MTSDSLGTCRCTAMARLGVPCTYAPTQEDLLCDHCRAGCVLVGIAQPLHVNNTGQVDATERIQAVFTLDGGAPAGMPHGEYASSTIHVLPGTAP